jgi:hypothetical protein
MRSSATGLTAACSRFLSAVSPCDHLLRLYDNDLELLDSLEEFVHAGFDNGDSNVVIATPEHLSALNGRLADKGCDLTKARSDQTYIEFDARDTLAEFMRDEWPEPERFESTIRDILLSVRGDGRHVRAFGEMVALLWSDGNRDATVRLEYLWNNLCSAEGFSLFCAYPECAFQKDDAWQLYEISAAHTHVLRKDDSNV